MMWDKGPAYFSHQDQELLNRLGQMAKGFDPVLNRYLTPEQTFAAVQHYTDLKDRFSKSEQEARLLKVREETALAQATAAKSQAEAAKSEAEASMEQARAQQARVQAEERIEMARLALAQTEQGDRLYLEEQKLALRKVELWITAMEMVSKAPPALAERLLGQVEAVGAKLLAAAPAERALLSDGATPNTKKV